MSDQLPGFFIAGFQKCATTALYNALARHPELSGPCIPPGPGLAGQYPKELAYFGANFDQGHQWYQERFPADQRIKFEATPYYTAEVRFLERMKNCVPDAKLILIMRDPVERAYSAWNHWLQSSPATRERWQMADPGGTFLSNIELEIQSRNPGHFWGLVGMGIYAPQIERVFRYYPEQKVLTLFSTDLEKAPGETIQRVLRFLEIEQLPIPVTSDHRRQYSCSMDEIARHRLREFFDPWDDMLEDLLGRPLPWRSAECS